MKRLFKNLEGKTQISETQVLNEWEKGIRKGVFPFLSTDEHGAFSKARLSVCRSNNEWVSIFEILSYVGESDQFLNKIYSYGNKIKMGYYPVELFSIPHDGETDLLDPLNFQINFQGKKYIFKPTSADYANERVNLNEPVSGSKDFDSCVYILRFLVNSPLSPDLFQTLDNLKQIVKCSENVPLFIQLHDWYHPSLGLSAHEAVRTPCFRSLASAIAQNQPSIYQCSSSLNNTHWSNWPNFFLEGKNRNNIKTK